MSDTKNCIYGVIAEFKTEPPIIMEGSTFTLEAAYERMREMEKNPRVIRAAVFRAVHESGHQGLIQGENQ